tara:strand:- start:3260 stop:3442 length:183 start_codon:yes stop_codon:yes gene_type:complete
MQRLKADGWKIDFTGVDPCEGASNQLKEEAIKEDLVASAQCYESVREFCEGHMGMAWWGG